MRIFASDDSEKGQVLLLVVLASVIALTVGLAAISRTITSTRISTEEANSQKALSAAEAGIEEQINKALTAAGGSISPSDGSFNESSFLASAEAVSGNNFEINDGELVSQDDGADIWLSDYPSYDNPVGSTTLSIYWNANNSNCGNSSNQPPAIEIAVVYGVDKANPNMERHAVDSCGTRPDGDNGFDSPTGTSSGPSGFSGYTHYYRFTVNNGRIARVIPLYNDAKIAVNSTTALPPQGYRIESTGTSGDTERKLKVFQGFPKLPIEFFPYNLFLP